MLQLIALRIMHIQLDTDENDILLGLGKVNEITSTELAMNVDTFWDNIM